MDKHFLRRLKDKINWVKSPLNAALNGPKKIKKFTSQRLRHHPWIQRRLNLPSAQDLEFLAYFNNNTSRDQWIELESPSQFCHQTPAISHDENRWFYEVNSHAQTDAAGLAVLHEGYVHGHNGGQFLNCSQEFLWDLGRENWKFFGSFFMDSVLRLPRPAKLLGTVAVLSHEYAYSNFSHWVFDCCPKVHLLQQADMIGKIDWFLVGHTQKSYQLETLLQLSIPQEKIIQFTPDSYIQAETLILPRLCGYQQQHHAEWKLNFLEETFGVKKHLTPWRKLFISRKDASFRHLQDEDKLTERLAKLGFETVTLSDLPLRETVSLFAEARAVVGPFGSGLMNIAFCQPNTSVVEIATPAFYNCYHWYLSGVRNLRHAVYFGDDGLLQPSKAPNQATKDISIDVDKCYEFIESFLGGD